MSYDSIRRKIRKLQSSTLSSVRLKYYQSISVIQNSKKRIQFKQIDSSWKSQFQFDKSEFKVSIESFLTLHLAVTKRKVKLNVRSVFWHVYMYIRRLINESFFCPPPDIQSYKIFKSCNLKNTIVGSFLPRATHPFNASASLRKFPLSRSGKIKSWNSLERANCFDIAVKTKFNQGLCTPTPICSLTRQLVKLV